MLVRTETHLILVITCYYNTPFSEFTEVRSNLYPVSHNAKLVLFYKPTSQVKWFWFPIKAHLTYSGTLWLRPSDESALLMSDVAHIPQTAASLQHIPSKQPTGAADMLREDPRDTLYQGERHRSLLHPAALEIPLS